MISNRHKRTIEQVINVFETSTPEGKYDAVAVLRDGTGGSRQITYGRPTCAIASPSARRSTVERRKLG